MILFLSDGKTPIEKISYDLGYKNENLEEIIKKLMDLKLIKKYNYKMSTNIVATIQARMGSTRLPGRS